MACLQLAFTLVFLRLASGLLVVSFYLLASRQYSYIYLFHFGGVAVLLFRVVVLALKDNYCSSLLPLMRLSKAAASSHGQCLHSPS